MLKSHYFISKGIKPLCASIALSNRLKYRLFSIGTLCHHSNNRYPYRRKFSSKNQEFTTGAINVQDGDIACLYPHTINDSYLVNSGMKVIFSDSESGAIGTLHGMAANGSKVTSIIPSCIIPKLMDPLQKIANSGLPCVIHVHGSAESVPSIFISVMFISNPRLDWANLISATPQEALDMAVIAHSASQQCLRPFLHSYDDLSYVDVNSISMISKQDMNNLSAMKIESGDVASTVQKNMDSLGNKIGRKYSVFDYFGNTEATHLIVASGSVANSVRQFLKNNPNYGLIQVSTLSTFPYFDLDYFMKSLPKTSRRLTILESNDELSKEIISALYGQSIDISVGNYKGEITPQMIGSIFSCEKPKFSVESVISTSSAENTSAVSSAIFYGVTGDDCVEKARLAARSLQSIASCSLSSIIPIEPQGAISTTYFKIGKDAESHSASLVDLVMARSNILPHMNVTSKLKNGGILLVNSIPEAELEFPSTLKKLIASKNIKLFSVDSSDRNLSIISSNIILVGCMQLSALKLMNKIPNEKFNDSIKLFSKEASLDAKSVETALNTLKEVKYPSEWISLTNTGESIALDIKNLSGTLPIWKHEKCAQCNECAINCPHAAVRPFLFKESDLSNAPKTFTTVAAKGLPDNIKGYKYRLQIAALNCTGCGQCVDVCGQESLVMEPASKSLISEAANWKYVSSLPHTNLSDIVPVESIRGSQLAKPYLEFSSACAGCGQTPVIKLLTQLFGNRMMISNALGCSSVWAGQPPTSHYIFDNEKTFSIAKYSDLTANYGLGVFMAITHQREQLVESVKNLLNDGSMNKEVSSLMKEWLEGALHDGPASLKISNQINSIINKSNPQPGSPLAWLLSRSHLLVEPSYWIIGGDAWGYGTGFSGLDTLIGSESRVNTLILDTEGYSITGGHPSKATPYGVSGKRVHKKDLGGMMMSYGKAYVASISLGADPIHAIKALSEAESFPGPSLVIAYTPCIRHGQEEFNSVAAQTMAVDSGYWPLYRYDPRLVKSGKNPFQLDSPDPSVSVKEFLEAESRFSDIMDNKETIKELEDWTRTRYSALQKRAGQKVVTSASSSSSEKQPRYQRGKSCVTAAPQYAELEARSGDQFKIFEAISFSPKIKLLRVNAPTIAKNCYAGQFVIVRANELAERIPLTIADFSAEEGWITLVIQNVGVSSSQICSLEKDYQLLDIVGPLGQASHIEKHGTVVCIGGGVGIAPVFPIQRALKQAGNKIISILGSKSKDLMFWEDKMKEYADECIVTTDDGTAGIKGFVTTALQGLIDKGEKIDLVLAIGPGIMMRMVSKLTEKYKIPTTVSLNTIMVDGTGMCGGCRVDVGGKTQFVCVDGPEFDGHLVNWDILQSRLDSFKNFEKKASEAKPITLDKLPPEKAHTRTPIPHQDAKFRVKNFFEVALGYTPQQALQEANRCKQCADPRCQSGCPVRVDIKKFIKHIQDGKFIDAANTIKQTNPCPAICGRVCPQENQCEGKCNLLTEDGLEAVAIGRLERFVADFEAQVLEPEFEIPEEKSGKKVAVVGAGPAGLVCAASLAQKGHEVTVFEALHGPGGVLIYGIPEFRLPKAVVTREMLGIKNLGVQYKLNYPVGPAGSLPKLMKEEGFDAAFIGTGAGLPLFLNIPGENLKGVVSSNEFLTRVNLMKAYKPGYGTPVYQAKRCLVAGGGNVAMDSARCARRLGMDVQIVYRRSVAELPARAEEVEHALEEGIVIKELVNPEEVLGDKDGNIIGIKARKMKLGEKDASGRRKPMPTDEVSTIDCDLFIVAIGNGPNPMLTKNWSELDLNKRGNIKADEKTLATNIPGAATVIKAMGAGLIAADGINNYLANLKK